MKLGVAASVLGLISLGFIQCSSGSRVIDAGFWFDGVSYGVSEANAERLGGAITGSELTRIEEVARAELGRAFSESRGIFGIGGQGAVNFRVIVSNAISYAPPGADRAAVIDGIGRGVGRTAAHEFAHLFLGSKDIHHGRDPRSYEFRNGDRAAQYYGDALGRGLAAPRRSPGRQGFFVSIGVSSRFPHSSQAP